jgi:hypothetical protein
MGWLNENPTSRATFLNRVAQPALVGCTPQSAPSFLWRDAEAVVPAELSKQEAGTIKSIRSTATSSNQRSVTEGRPRPWRAEAAVVRPAWVGAIGDRP